MKKIGKDILVITGILLAAVLFYLVPRMINRENAGWVKVYQNGNETAAYSLTEDRTVTIPCAEGGYNLLMISGGEAFVSDADCPDHLCVKQRSISKNGESIICLPHKLVIQIESDKEGTLDAVTH